MYANRYHANRPSALTAADRARMAAAVARFDAARAAARRRERFARAAAVALIIAAGVTPFYAASEPESLPPEVMSANRSASR